jgi:hypothetical protein
LGAWILHFGCLESGTKRAERRIHIIGFFPYRAIVDSIGKLDRISAMERCASRMSQFIHYKHAEPGKEVF